MRHELQSPPRTIMEVFRMLPEGTLAEIIEGTLYMSPSPTRNHQEILGEIFLAISNIQPKGKAFLRLLMSFSMKSLTPSNPISFSSQKRKWIL